MKGLRAACKAGLSVLNRVIKVSLCHNNVFQPMCLKCGSLHLKEYNNKELKVKMTNW